MITARKIVNFCGLFSFFFSFFFWDPGVFGLSDINRSDSQYPHFSSSSKCLVIKNFPILLVSDLQNFHYFGLFVFYYWGLGVQNIIEKWKLFSCVLLFANPLTLACQGPLSTGFHRQEYWSDRHSLLQGILPSQESNPGLLHCRQILYSLSHQGSQIILCRLKSNWL